MYEPQSGIPAGQQMSGQVLLDRMAFDVWRNQPYRRRGQSAWWGFVAGVVMAGVGFACLMVSR